MLLIAIWEDSAGGINPAKSQNSGDDSNGRDHLSVRFDYLEITAKSHIVYLTLNYNTNQICHCEAEPKQSIPTNIRDRHAPYGARDDKKRVFRILN